VRVTCILGCLLATASCASPTADDTPSWMTATILEADSSANYVGGGNYGTTEGFSIVSRGTGESLGQTVIFRRNSGTRPSPGQYAFGAPSSVGEGFSGYYRRTLSDGTRQQFVVSSGSIEIATSTEGSVEGSFDLTALLFCSTGPGEVQDDCAPETLIDDAPSVRVTGSFAVGPYGLISVS
jgi:hypothetical protein